MPISTYTKAALPRGGLRQVSLSTDEPAKHATTRTNNQVVRAELTGDDMASIGDIVARGSTPVLSLCRELLAQGMNPDQALEVYRGSTLALKVRSIGEAAKLEVNNKGTGFAPFRAVRAASPVRQIEVAAIQASGAEVPP